MNTSATPIELPDVLITIDASGVTIEHRKSGMISETSLAKLQQWALLQLRKELIPVKAAA